MRTLAATFALLVIVPLAAAQAATPEPHDYYLAADGKLTSAPTSATACMTLAGPNAAQTKKDFAANVTPGEWRVLGNNLTLTVAFSGANGNAQSGTGFDLSGALQLGNLTPIQAPPQRFAAGQSPSVGTLTFPLDNTTLTNGVLKLSLALTPTSGQLPIGAAQDVQLLCGHPQSKLAAFAFATTEIPPPSGDEGLIKPVNLPLVFGIALAAGGATMLGGFIVLAGRSISQRRLHVLLGGTAGLLIAIALLDLIPESVKATPTAPYTVAIGVLGLFVIKWVAGDAGHAHGGHGHSHDAAHDHEPHDHAHTVGSHSSRLALIAFFALGFHRFVDGLVLPPAFTAGNATGLAAATAVLIHQFPDGIAAATVFIAGGWARKKVLRGVAVMALLTPLGAIAGLALLGLPNLVGHLIALAAATFIFIALAELLPELSGREHRIPVGVGFVLGYAVAFFIILIPSWLGISV